MSIERDAGSTITLLAEFRKYTPFQGYDLFDPNPVPTVTVVNEAGTDVIAAQNMTKSVVGKYYYHVQTLTTWAKGAYDMTTNATDGTYNDVTTTKGVFILK